MELGSIFLILALLILVSLFVTRPFVEANGQHRVSSPSRADHDRSTLLAERDRLLNTLQELDFDYAMGKIPDEDYPAQRAALVQRGADILRLLDVGQDRPYSEAIETQVEVTTAEQQSAVLSAFVGTGNSKLSASRAASAVVAAPDDELEVLLANRRRVRQDKAAGFCPKCGGALRKSDRFCPKCGALIV